MPEVVAADDRYWHRFGILDVWWMGAAAHEYWHRFGIKHALWWWRWWWRWQ